MKHCASAVVWSVSFALALSACDLDQLFDRDDFACSKGGPCPGGGTDAALDRDGAIGRDADVDRDADSAVPTLVDARLVDAADASISDGETRDAVVDGGLDCDGSTCGATACCPYGSRCVSGQCAPEPDPNLCTECSNRRGDCAGRGHLCLTNPNYDPVDPTMGFQFRCGIECSPQNECPNGYRCEELNLRTAGFCENDFDCDGNRTCIIADGDRRGVCSCLDAADCLIEELPPACLGSCAGTGILDCRADRDCNQVPCDISNKRCQWPEGRSCSDDDDCESAPLCVQVGSARFCVTDGTTCTRGADCRCLDNRCIGSRRPCGTAADCDVPCTGGKCVVGQACTPASGLICGDL